MNLKKDLKMNKFKNQITPGQSLEFRMDFPERLHWKELEKYPFFGEIYCTTEDKYYSRQGGRKYRPKVDKEHHHLDEGHFQGFSFGIEHFSNPGGWVLDPFVGSGTAMVESYLKGRNSIGIELEFSTLLEKNLEYLEQHYFNGSEYRIHHGDSRKILNEIPMPELDLVITGFPYPKIGGSSITADAPLRENHISGDLNYVKPVGYLKEDSLGDLKYGPKFLEDMEEILSVSGYYLKKGGRLITLIKDCISGGQPFFLQKYVMDYFLENNPDFEIEGWYVHRHIPQTFFMNNYLKKHPEKEIPLYQIGLVLKKI